MKPTWIIGLIIGVIAILILVLLTMGFINIPGLQLPGTPETPPDSDYCGFTDAQIVEMIGYLTNKNLDVNAGIGFVRSLNMQACGSTTALYTDIANHYKTTYNDQYLFDEQDYSGPGWNAKGLVWLNDPSTNATYAWAVLTGQGTTINTLYGYNTITITSDGTYLNYQLFMLWIAAS